MCKSGSVACHGSATLTMTHTNLPHNTIGDYPFYCRSNRNKTITPTITPSLNSTSLGIIPIW